MMIIYRNSAVVKVLIPLIVLVAIYFTYNRIEGSGSKMPDIEYRTVMGKTLTAENLEGRVIVFNFWSTGCGPCIAGMPDLERIYQEYKYKGVEVIAVASWHNQLKEIVGLSYAKKLSFTMAYDAEGNAAKAWGGIRYTPTTFVVDRNGRVVDTFVGNDFERLTSVIETLI